MDSLWELGWILLCALSLGVHVCAAQGAQLLEDVAGQDASLEFEVHVFDTFCHLLTP